MTEPKKRKPRRKPKPAMPDNLRPFAAAAIEKHYQRFTPPALEIGGNPDGVGLSIECPYREEDRDNWKALLYQAFGTRSIAVAKTFLHQLSDMCPLEWHSEDEAWRPSIDHLNTAIAVVASAEPENEAQACIAAQMVSLHFTAMKLAKIMGGHTRFPDERTAATAARVSKTYAQLALMLARLQGKGGRHDQHFHYHAHDEKHVHMGGGGNFGGQAQATEEIDLVHSSNERRPALPSPGAHYGGAVPLGGSEGQASVPNAWWFTRLWSAVRGAQR